MTSDGEIILTEIKSSQTASLTKNQKYCFALIQQNGGVIIKPKNGRLDSLPDVIEPTNVQIIREPHQHDVDEIEKRKNVLENENEMNENENQLLENPDDEDPEDLDWGI